MTNWQLRLIDSVWVIKGAFNCSNNTVLYITTATLLKYNFWYLEEMLVILCFGILIQICSPRFYFRKCPFKMLIVWFHCWLLEVIDPNIFLPNNHRTMAPSLTTDTASSSDPAATTGKKIHAIVSKWPYVFINLLLISRWSNGWEHYNN